MTPRPTLVLAVAIAGAVGALARSGLAAVLPDDGGGLPVATLVANLSGCLLLGLLAGRAPSGSRLRPVLGAGLLGGWTTWSGLAVETDLLLAEAPLLAAGYLVVSLAGGTALARVGLRAGRR